MTIPKLLAHRKAVGDKAAVMELKALTGPESQNPPPSLSKQPMSLEYTSTQLESARTNLEVCAKQVSAYMVDHGECVQLPPPSALPIQMTTTAAPSKGLGFPVTESVAAPVTAIMEHTVTLQQLGSYVTKMND